VRGRTEHRLDLSDGVLIKNNHIALAGGAATALERALRNRRGNQPIEIEVRSLEEMRQALDHGAEAILLDNMSPDAVREAITICSGLSKRPPLECSGGSVWRMCGLTRRRAWILFRWGADPFVVGGGYEYEGCPGVGASLVVREFLVKQEGPFAEGSRLG